MLNDKEKIDKPPKEQNNEKERQSIDQEIVKESRNDKD